MLVGCDALNSGNIFLTAPGFNRSEKRCRRHGFDRVPLIRSPAGGAPPPPPPELPSSPPAVPGAEKPRRVKKSHAKAKAAATSGGPRKGARTVAEPEPDEPAKMIRSVDRRRDGRRPGNYRTAFMIRADQAAARFATYRGPITKEIAATARAVALAWRQTLAGQIDRGLCLRAQSAGDAAPRACAG